MTNKINKDRIKAIDLFYDYWDEHKEVIPKDIFDSMWNGSIYYYY